MVGGISSIVGYLMPNPFYTYIKYMICKHILKITFLNEPELFCTQIKGFKYCYITVTIYTSYLFAHSLFYLTDRQNPTGTTTTGQSRPESNGNKRYYTFPNFSGLSLTIIEFNVLSRTLIWRNGVGIFYSSS